MNKVKIKEVCNILRGKEPGSNAYGKGNIPFIRVGTLSKPNNIVYIEENEKFRYVKKSDLLFSTDGSPGIVKMGFEGYISGGIVKIEPKNNKILNPKYIFYYLQTPQVQQIVKECSRGTTIKHASSCLDKIEIPLPSIEEQEKIVQILDQVYENIGWDIEDKIADLKALKKTAIDKAIRGLLTTQNHCESAEELYKNIQEEKEKLLKEGKIKKSKKDEINPINEDEIPFEIPKNWKWCRLGEVSYKLTDGSHNPPKGQSIKTDYLMLSSKNINNSMITNLKECRYLNQSDYESENNRTLLQKEDLLLTTVGTIGRSCLYDGELNIVLQRSVSVINTGFYNKYLKYLLDSNYGQSYLMEHASGTAQKGIYLNQLKEMPVVIPPLEEQERIVNILSAIDSAIDSAIELQEDNKKLLDSLLNKFLN